MTRIFFATDVHGSERCFMKFINAAKIYKTDVIILGGDITGKMIVPILEQSKGIFEVEFLGSTYKLRKMEELKTLEKNIRDYGGYPFVTTSSELEEIKNDKHKAEALFMKLAKERLQKWVEIAEERLHYDQVKCFISCGNDDFDEFKSILNSSSHVMCPEGKVIWINSKHEMISLGYSNITPWNCPRDIPEEELQKKINEVTSMVSNMRSCIFNFHCPPYNSNLDLAPKLDQNLRPVLSAAGGPEMVPVGSKACRNSIERHQPLLGLHGHIHESTGFSKIGKTLCINPGSAYTEGILKGTLIEISDDRVKQYLLTTG